LAERLQGGRLLRRPQQDYPAASVAEYCSAVLTRMKAAAREAVAQTLERGGEVRAPRVREVEQRRGETQDRHRAAAEKTAKDLER